MNIAASAASTALPPARSVSAPAAGVTGWPAATTPRMAGRSDPRDVLGHVDVDVARIALARRQPAHPRLARRLAQSRRALVAPRRPRVPLARGHHGHPHPPLLQLLLDPRAQD